MKMRLKKISLQVLEINEKAIQLYRKLGFEVARNFEKMIKDCQMKKYYNTVVMGRGVFEVFIKEVEMYVL